MTKEALKLALEAFNDLAAWNDGEVGSHMDEPYAAEVARITITTIEQALAQPEPEPVAIADGTFNHNCPIGTPLYTAPAHQNVNVDDIGVPVGVGGWLTTTSSQPEQEPVAWLKVGGMKAMPALEKEAWLSTGRQFDQEIVEEYTIPLYTTPPQRKPLTEQEIGAILEDINAFGTRLYTFARAVEAAHGIKGKA